MYEKPHVGCLNPTPLPLPLQMPILNRNLYLNPQLQQGNSAQPGNQRNEDVKKVIDILPRNTKKRNPILVWDSEPKAVINEVLRRIEKGELGEGPLKNVQVIPIEKELASDKTQIPAKLRELGGLVEGRIGDSNGGGIILALGDLKWLVEQPVGIGVSSSDAVAQQVVSETLRSAVAEMAKVIARFAYGNSTRNRGNKRFADGGKGDPLREREWERGYQNNGEWNRLRGRDDEEKGTEKCM